MTASVAEPCSPLPHRPVLRRLADILPSEAPAALKPPPATAPPAADPAASVLAERVLRAAMELLVSQRPARQLSTVLCPDVLAHLIGLQKLAGHLQPRVRKVIIQQNAAGTLEAVALVTLSTGVRALAARFDKHEQNSQWQCTALQLRLTAGDLKARRR